MEENTVIEWIYLTKQGNQEAFNALIKFCYRYVENLLYSRYHYFTSLISGEELVQEAMIVAERSMYAYNPEKQASFITFLTICCVRRWYTMISRKKTKNAHYKQRDTSLDQVLRINEGIQKPITMIETIEDPYPMRQPMESFYINEMLESAYQILNQAKNKDIKVLFELKASGYSDSEIAKKMKTSEKWVTNTLYRYRKKFHFNKH